MVLILGKVFQVGFKGAETIDVTIDDAASDAIGAFNMHTVSQARILGATHSEYRYNWPLQCRFLVILVQLKYQ